MSTVFLGSTLSLSPHTSYPSCKDLLRIHPLAPGSPPSPGEACRTPQRRAYSPESPLSSLLPPLRPLPPPLSWKTAPPHPGLSPPVIHSDLGQGHTPSPSPARLVYFLGLIASVILSPAYFVSPVPSSSPPFLSFFATSCRRTGTLSCSSAQTRVSQPRAHGQSGPEPPLFGGL